MTQFRIRQGQPITLSTIASGAFVLRAEARIAYDDATFGALTLPAITTSGSRINEDWISGNTAAKDGYVTFSYVQPVTADIRRGQCWTRLAVGQPGALFGILSQDYVYETHWATLGEMADPGPGGGDGFLAISGVKVDGAPAATTTVTLRGTKSIRVVHGYSWYYNASADVAARTLDVALRKIWIITALPTGFNTDANADVWRAVQVAVAASEEANTFATPKVSGKNTNGTIAQDNQASAASPFPLLVRRDDLSELVFTVANGNANDRDKIQVLYEEWIVP